MINQTIAATIGQARASQRKRRKDMAADAGTIAPAPKLYDGVFRIENTSFHIKVRACTAFKARVARLSSFGSFCFYCGVPNRIPFVSHLFILHVLVLCIYSTDSRGGLFSEADIQKQPSQRCAEGVLVMGLATWRARSGQ